MIKNIISYISIVIFIFCFVVSVKAEQGLAGWWKFDEGAGDVLHDSSGNGNDGKIYGAEWIKKDGVLGLLFDGKDDYVDCGNDVSLKIDGPLTISMWINVSILSARRQYVISKKGWNLAVGETPNMVAFFETRDAYNTKWIDMGSVKNIPTDIWVYIATVYSIKNKEMVFYIDGEKIRSEERTDDGIGWVEDFNLTFGKEAGPPPCTFSGVLNEVKIYNKDLTSEEINNNYQSEKTTKK